MNSSREPWNQVACITPSSCHTVRKRSHSRASRSTAQSSTSWRMVRRSAVTSVMNSLSFAGLAPAFHRLNKCVGWMRGSRAGQAMARLEGRVAIVTGGARGIGRHYSSALAAEGARVMIADIADGTQVAAEIGAKYGANSVASETCDVSDESAVSRVVEPTLARFGKIDVLVNNAALYAPLHETKFTAIDVDLWDKVMAVNLRGPFLMAKHVAPEMAKRQYGKIINIGSGTAVRGIPWLMHYVTSKGGIMAMTRTMLRELGDDGIRVNTLMPGFTLSDSIVSENPGHVETARGRAIASRALKRDEQPDDLTGTLIFLASADSDFITGQMIAVDGGNVNT